MDHRTTAAVDERHAGVRRRPPNQFAREPFASRIFGRGDMRVGLVCAALLPVVMSACQTQSAPPPAQPADLYGPPEKPAPVTVPDISTERMSEITRVLASDEFQGRSMGTPGEE